MSHQDWKPVIFSSVQKQKNAKPVSVPDEHIKIKKIESEEYVIPKISVSLQNKIKEARMAKGLSQKDLAIRLNIKQSVVSGYESGKLVPDNKTLQTMSRVLDQPLNMK